ncbi:MAG: beta-1,3-glucanase family protein [bacterium]
MRPVRRVIAVLAATAMFVAGLWTTQPGTAVAANNLGLKTIPFRIINNSGKSGRLFLYVVGNVPSMGGKSYFVSNVNGDLTIVPKIDPPGMSLGLDLGTATTIDVQLPQLTAARIYFSIGQGLLVMATAEGAPPSAPPGWVPQDPNFNTYFDFAEFTWLDDAGGPFVSTLGMNATQVDMFAIPFLLALKGKNDAGTVITRRSGFNDLKARDKIFGDLLKAGHPWTNLIMKRNKRADALRVVAPYLGIQPLGVFPTNFLAQYINQVWQKYTTEILNAESEGHTYAGGVAGGELVFHDMAVPGDPPFKFVKPSTETAFRNELQPIPNPPGPGPGARARAIAALLGAAFMRTNLLTSTDLNACVVAGFYVSAPINEYAEGFHKYALDHLAYSFGYDDTCEQSSFIQIHDPEMMTITLQKF